MGRSDTPQIKIPVQIAGERTKGKRRFGPAARGLVDYWAVSERRSSRVDAKDDAMENSALFAGAVRFERTVSFLAGALSVDSCLAMWFGIPAAYPGFRCIVQREDSHGSTGDI